MFPVSKLRSSCSHAISGTAYLIDPLVFAGDLSDIPECHATLRLIVRVRCSSLECGTCLGRRVCIDCVSCSHVMRFANNGKYICLFGGRDITSERSGLLMSCIRLHAARALLLHSEQPNRISNIVK